MSRVVAPPVAAPPAALANGPVQVSVATGAAGLLAVGALWLAARYGPRHGALLLVGAALGLTLHHAAFGFTAAYRALVTVGDGRGVRAQLLMLATATVLFAPVLAAGEIFGRPVAGAVAPAGVSVLVGAFVFAVGMQLAGGCGSGMLYHLGAGVTPMAVTLVGFVGGAVLATFHMPFWWATPSLGAIALGDALGWWNAVLIQLAACALLAVVSRWAERGRAGVPSPPPARGWPVASPPAVAFPFAASRPRSWVACSSGTARGLRTAATSARSSAGSRRRACTVGCGPRRRSPARRSVFGFAVSSGSRAAARRRERVIP